MRKNISKAQVWKPHRELYTEKQLYQDDRGQHLRHDRRARCTDLYRCDADTPPQCFTSSTLVPDTKIISYVCHRSTLQWENQSLLDVIDHKDFISF